MVRTFGGGIYEQFTNLFIPKAIKEEVIPAELREAVEARVGGAERKWYAAAPAGDSFFSAVDCEQGDPPVRRLHLALWEDRGDSLPHPVAEVTIPIRFDKPFGGGPDPAAAGGVSAGEGDKAAQAGGWAWDKRVATVVGKTVNGAEARVTPVNGCWLLVAEGGPDAEWREFRALDRRGKVMYSQEFHPPS
jgi:hypothetical protein